MGTCIGKRNLVYFISFLFCTALHAFLTLATCAALFNKDSDLNSLPEEGNTRLFAAANMGVTVYTAMIGSTLLMFGLYTTCLAMDNITSNENLRTRWNARRANVLYERKKRFNKDYEKLSPSDMELYERFRENEKLANERKASCTEKLKYFFCRQKHESYMAKYLQLRDEEHG